VRGVSGAVKRHIGGEGGKVVVGGTGEKGRKRTIAGHFRGRSRVEMAFSRLMRGR